MLFEYDKICTLAAEAWRRKEEWEARYLRAEDRVKHLELRLIQAKQNASEAKEAYRDKTIKHAELAQRKGEIEDELFPKPEDFESYWGRHQ
jgi:hypothetical protein